MADQVFAAYSGFYDAVDDDRTYSADEMNRPYRRLVSNGVFATPQGTPSTDLQVLSNNSMVITVSAGEGIFGNKWFENTEPLSITVPQNNNTTPRIDSVIIQIDTRASGRIGNVVYRTGTPASAPLPPAINELTGVFEYRVANVRVEASASSISQSKITDLRGSSECPWITSLIYQVDTSALYAQWQSAYAEYYEQSTEQFEQEEAARQQDWDDFYDTLTEDLTISTNVIMLTYKTTANAGQTIVPLHISGFRSQTDLLMVYVNGLFVDPSGYTLASSNPTMVIFNNALLAGDTVYFVVLKAVLDADPRTVESMIQQIEDDYAALAYDSGWVTATLDSALEQKLRPDSGSYVRYRKVGKVCSIEGSLYFQTRPSDYQSICSIPNGYHPEQNLIIFAPILATTSFVSVAWNYGTGKLEFGKIPSFSGDMGIYFNMTFLVSQ